MLLLAAIDQHSAAYRTGEILAIAALGVLALGLGVRAFDRHGRRASSARRTDAIAALVCAALLVGALVHFSGGRSSGAWDTQQGRSLHAGFVAGCQRSAGALVDCDCVFAHLTSAPPYDTPTGFLSLGGVENVAAQTGNARSLPPQVLNALLACRQSG